MEYGELEATLEKPGSLNIRNGNGSIFLFLNGEEKDYGLNLYTEYGVISTPGKRIEPDEAGQYNGASYTRGADGQTAVYAETEYGDITVREMKR